MRRLPDWEARLAAYLEPLRTTPFAWGQHDCVTFSAGAVEAMTGERVLPAAGRYRTAIGAARAVKRIGGGGLAAAVDTVLASVPPALAHRGDILLIDGSLGLAFDRFAIMVGEEGSTEGLIRRPRELATHAWRVPFAETPHG